MALYPPPPFPAGCASKDLFQLLCLFFFPSWVISHMVGEEGGGQRTRGHKSKVRRKKMSLRCEIIVFLLLLLVLVLFRRSSFDPIFKFVARRNFLLLLHLTMECCECEAGLAVKEKRRKTGKQRSFLFFCSCFLLFSRPLSFCGICG